MSYGRNSVDRDLAVRELMRPLRQYLDIRGATEVVINEPGRVFVEVGPAWVEHGDANLDMPRLLSLARAVGTYSEQDVDESRPILSATLPSGERVQIVLPPAVPNGSISVSIRIPGAQVMLLDEFEQQGAFGDYVWAEPSGLAEDRHGCEPEDLRLAAELRGRRLKAFLTRAVAARKNIAVVGDTGSGKTTLMKALCLGIDERERLVTIEDVRELRLPNHRNCVHLMYSKGGQGRASVTPSDLIAATMRMKPDRVLLAELRGAEAYDFLKLLTTGHSGSITSFHAESCALARERYVFMCKENTQAATFDDTGLKQLIALTLDVIVHVVAQPVMTDDGGSKRRYVSEVHFDPIAKRVARFGNARVHGKDGHA